MRSRGTDQEGFDIMAFSTPKGWDKESDTLFIHSSGVRVERRTYRGQEGWFLIPVDLDQEVLTFEPTPEGRDKAFEAFADGKLKPVRKKSAVAEKASDEPAKPKRGRKPKPRPEPEPEEEEGGMPAEPAAAEKEAEEEDDDDDDEDEEEEAEDEKE